ncbi:uncharacterized protein [Aristolochia californica]|uniref:uncharacterized protein isoform X2 n=1 Tax=Aristolochia californica TaxID=171875 RepID=UPI0035E37DAC
MEGETLAVLDEIQVLVSDKLQVVSYKWLSRNFSVSSNDAKRLLQKFVQEHGSGLEVIYTLSGWLKNNPEIYHVKLVSGFKLAVKQEFEDNFSVQVYSVQASIPKDPAALWNAEFIQAEELFKQPSDIENCLRDNRFCGVFNAFVKRSIDGKSVACNLPQPKISNLRTTSNSNAFPQVSSVPQPREGRALEASPKDLLSASAKAEEEKLEKNTSKYTVLPCKSHTEKEKSQVDLSNKKKNLNEKGLSSGGSLANMWSRASAKSKSSCPSMEITNGASDPAVTADAQIHANEAVDGLSSEDEGHNAIYRRDSNGENNRKRRVVFDFSDEEDDYTNVVSLASQDPPKSNSTCDSQKNLLVEEKDMNLVIKQEKTPLSTSIISPEKELEGSSNRKTHEQRGENLVMKQEKTPLSTSIISPEKELEGSSNRKTHEQRGENLVMKQEKTPLSTSIISPEIELEGSSNRKTHEQRGENLVMKQEKTPLSTSIISPEKELEGSGNRKTSDISLLEKPPSHLSEGLNDRSKKDKVMNVLSTSPKRRKVLKTRVDERGREVTEVVWEGEVEDSSNTEKKTVTDYAVKNEPNNSIKPPAANKVLPLATSAPTKVGHKAGNKKTGKGGMKDAKQGNILSFFKKI